MTAPAGGPGQKVPAQVRAATGDQSAGTAGDAGPAAHADHGARRRRSINQVVNRFGVNQLCFSGLHHFF